MPTKRKRSRSNLVGTPLDRRQALKGMGVFAVAAPTLIAACSESAVSGGTGGTGGGVSATGGVTGTGGLGTGGATGGVTGTGGLLGTGGATGGVTGTGGILGTGGNGTGGAAGKAGTGGAAGAGGAAGKAGTGGAAGAAGATGAGGTSGSLVSMFDKAASCTLTPTDPAGEGPFFIHDGEGSTEELIRSDTRDGQAGVTLQLNLRMLDTTMGCNVPVSGAQVYVWHTNALGFYSGFNNQNPDMPYSGSAERTPDNQDRFLRGIQLTDDNGIVSFTQVFPGWYDGRAIHIHFIALRPGSTPDTSSYRSTQYMIFTTQMYFPEAFSRNIHENNAPYNTRASGANYDKYVKPETMVQPTSHMDGNTAVAFLNILTASNGSRR
jgi:protocatechuate 3,4-dioxygenase beta subunit